ncbi:MAG: DUF805 domain-containing protein [Proteobacteria bacterium]|nr:DUF805 domain-containing protein [Pseudomonadota bacterium]MDE2412681.1 DUF805 domain-containing protein [Sphingomonadales bacterium]
MDSFRRVSFTGLLLKILRQTASFGGRSTRAELIVGLIAALVLARVAVLLAELAAPNGNPWPAIVLQVIAALPLPALIVRRLHDHSRSGWWIMPALFAFTLAIARSIVAATQGFEARIALDRVIWPLDWIAIVGNVAMLVLLVLPGTKGPNRFGPDPRRGA